LEADTRRPERAAPGNLDRRPTDSTGGAEATWRNGHR
jgi:hypothetical protein